MPDAFDDLQRAIDAAEQAAAAGNLATAEVHLHEVLRLQTGYVGERDPDVAATLHKLAIVYERTGRLQEAETMYRRAVDVASEVLPADDPLFLQCRDDLHSFLSAMGLPAAAEPAQAAPPPSRPAAPVPPPVNHVRTAAAAPTPAAPPAAPRPPYRPPAPAPPSSLPSWLLAALGVAAALAVVALFWRSSSGPASTPVNGDAANPPAVAPSAPGPTAAPSTSAELPPAAPAPAAPAATPPVAAPAAQAARPEPAPAPPPSTPAPTPAPAPATRSADAGGVRILDARLCRQLTPSGAWTCVPPESPPTAGRYYYLTRVAAPGAAQVEHRWYRGDRVVQAVPLTIRGGGPAGYRTYSRQTVLDTQPGEWRVEVRSAAGVVLAEERFTVQ